MTPWDKWIERSVRAWVRLLLEIGDLIFGVGEPCQDFDPAYFGEWPEILTKVPINDDNPVGVECTRFEVTW